jgi:Tol biopolymer transport system component
MLCHNCGKENREDYKFCVQCGTARKSVTPPGAGVNNNPPPAVYQPARQEASGANALAARKRPLASLFKNKAAMIALVIGLGIVCLLTLAIVVVFIFPKLGGGGSGILIGIPTSDGEADLYTLRLGQDLEQATLLAENVLESDLYVYSLQDSQYSRIGNPMLNFGGFVPNQNRLVFWYADSDGESYLQRFQMNQDAPTELYHGNFNYMYGTIYNNGRDIFLREFTNDENRCYVSANGAEAERITRGNQCDQVSSGSILVTYDYNNNEATLTLMNLDGSNEITILDGQADVNGYRVSYDGSRVAYVSTENDQQIRLVNGRNGEVITEGETSHDILMYYFANQSNRFIYLAENEDGEQELYLLDDEGSLLVASGWLMNADISNDGGYIVYMVGDEDGEETVFSYNVSNGESIEITQGQELSFNLESQLQRVIVAQQDGDTLTLISTRLDGSSPVTLYDDSNSYLSDVGYYPDRSRLFVSMTNDNGETSIFYTQPDNPDGYFLFEEYHNLSVLDLSPNGSQLLVNAQENSNDDPALMVLAVQPDQSPVTLDDNGTDFPSAVFTSNGRQVIYTAQTGSNGDEYEIRRISVNAADPAETIYPDAYLVDVQWTRIQPFYYVYLYSMEER